MQDRDDKRYVWINHMFPLRRASTSSNSPHVLKSSNFRANLVTQGAEAYAEDHWHSCDVEGVTLESIGPCGRCQVICIDPGAGKSVGPSPLRTLAEYRRAEGKINFGLLLAQRRFDDDVGSTTTSEIQDCSLSCTRATTQSFKKTGCRTSARVSFDPYEISGEELWLRKHYAQVLRVGSRIVANLN
mmetsp:Transcript_344/g.588  ORF Transcript_344/g.588 Transcript_344/m.588 type:complete len:186 (+) Transcript_344:1595-2152(+)